MRYRILVLVPLLWVAILAAAELALGSTPGHTLFLRVEVELAKAVALAGALAAAFGFARGEYLRRAWLLVGGCMALLLVRDLTLLPPVAGAIGTSALGAVRGVLVVAANLSQLWGTFMLARAWRVASLALPVSPRAQAALVAAVVVVVVAVTGPGCYDGFARLGAGDLAALPGLGSALGDAGSLLLVAPLFLTALALRGGIFGWPFALLTTSYLAWMLYDATVVFGPALGLQAAATRSLSEVWRALGCLLGFSAGLAQRFVVEDVRRAR